MVSVLCRFVEIRVDELNIYDTGSHFYPIYIFLACAFVSGSVNIAVLFSD